ncbi:hypothetical protein R1flu_026004 [Riccia fluitans]|uniref:Exostosin GT47 domain-containing protein n=1 Tax=Riccia fluitans TaxID=41844 RepID=A0ABD1XER3_9MARC
MMLLPRIFFGLFCLAIAEIILFHTDSKWTDCGLVILEALKPGRHIVSDVHSPLEEEKEHETSVECHGRRIFMYDLPSKFNVNYYLNETLCRGGLMAWMDLCERFQHGGYGRRYYLAENEYEGQWDGDWYDRDFYMLEAIFHSRMLTYTCRTLDPKKADAFFVPYYTGIDALPLLYAKPNTFDTFEKRKAFGSEIVDWLDQNAHEFWHKYQGRDHFIMLGRTCSDFRPRREWGTGWVDRPYMSNVVQLTIESEKENEQAVPYPTAFHPSSPERLRSWVSEVERAERTFLVVYVGAPRPELDWSIRGIVSRECKEAGNTSCHMVDCSKLTCSHSPVLIYKTFLQSNFCLQPRGDSATRRSTFDCMIAGSIPVFFHRDSAYSQYTWHLPQDPSSYSVFISEDELKDAKSILKVLESYFPERIQKMRDTILSFIPNLIYNNFSNSISSNQKDAFELSIERVLERIADSMKGLRATGGGSK